MKQQEAWARLCEVLERKESLNTITEDEKSFLEFARNSKSSGNDQLLKLKFKILMGEATEADKKLFNELAKQERK